MDPFEILIKTIRIGLLFGLAGVLAWTARERAAVHRVWRQRLHDGHRDVVTLPYWMTAGTIAGFV